MTELKLKLLFRKLENNGDQHFRGQIIQRTTDGNKETKILKRYTFDTLDKLDKAMPEIKELCDTNNARFYLNPNVKSYKAIGFDLLERTVQNLRSENYKAMRTMYDSVADANKGIRDKQYWILDIDTKDELAYIHITNNSGIDFKDSIEIGTKNGRHILIRPQQLKLDLKDMKDTYFTEVKKNSMTLLYWAGKDKPAPREKKVLLG